MAKRYGWRPDLPDKRDFLFSVSFGVMRSLPARVDLRPQCPPVVSQGTLGSCVANATASAHYFDQKKQNSKDQFQPSRLFLYYNTRKIGNTVLYDSGSNIRDGFKSIARDGVCPETMWKYQVSKFAVIPPAPCYKEALKHQAVKYMRVRQSLSQMRGCLADGYPFVFGFMVYESFESSVVARTGVVPMPEDDESDLGGHAVTCVGYDDKSQRFIVQNSWGTSWGDKGFFYMPYDYLTAPNLADDFWCVRTVEI